VVIELAGDTQFSRDLAAGGVFVPGCLLRLADECDLVVCGVNAQLSLPARVVYIEEQRGVGLELIGFSAEVKAQLAELEPFSPSDLVVIDEPDIEAASLERAAEQRALADEDLAHGGPYESAAMIDLESLLDPGADDLALPVAGAPDDLALPIERDERDYRDYRSEGTGRRHDDAADTNAFPRINLDARATHSFLAELDTLPPDGAAGHPRDAEGGDRDVEAGGAAAGDVDDPDRAEGSAGGAADTRDDRPFARNVHERLRGLGLAAQLKMAVSGELHERIVLERLYGKNVWETLLRNPRLTAPEVARIARYGSLPRVLLEIIVGNSAWLQIPEVRRALLSNPRLATDQIVKILRLTPKHELKLAAVQTAYPHAVRNAARMLLRSE
jgi:hypothetical protein